jgi:putative restriction endonuclease
MKMYIGLTDFDWYTLLSSKKLDEVNFWKPGTTPFRALEPNDLFLFKLKSPYNAVVGGGFFVRYVEIPINMAWETFGDENGTVDQQEFASRIIKYRQKNGVDVTYPQVGCIILTEPFFFDRPLWIKGPADMAKNIVTGKLYSTEAGEGKRVFEEVMTKLPLALGPQASAGISNRYGESFTKHRLGQGGFRILVTESYNRQCAISGEKTLPVLQAAHIKPYSDDGPNEVNNGILLRSDIHKLFDDGYITITPNLEVLVSGRLHSDFGNGKLYYQYNKEKLLSTPESRDDMPSREFLEWHNDTVFLR